ncbi:metallophosphoesterase family protein [Fructilactobacillus florum]|uniref:Calcineurin-like phosphoesterase domain-containing protein n=1 Tax=Fructilactobacillus florum DSM 22689 = JCM 16035 TaxID=1423745 RepID=A0A0R2CKV8_9LACO|nr:exonuclease SbcCD subunit D [Fructilactobacillus florum]KRM91856.1 hypothetical protein FC87_GL000681 [Fructilactobacillus florum DSM 22689 = JCM 16035]
MKFIHTADLHLDTPYQGLQGAGTPQELWKKLRQGPYDSFHQLVNDALEQQIDFMLIVGDIFDSQHQSVTALNAFTTEMERLQDAQIPVYLSFGNHDFQADDGRGLHLPANVHIFPQEPTTLTLTLADGKTVAITGFSYGTRAVTTDKAAAFPYRGTADYQIGMIHGAEKTGANNNYAPFTVNELLEKNYDYWALGHIHKRMELCASPLIEYPGNIQGRHKNETGEKGYLQVDDSAGHLSKSFHETSPIIFSSLSFSLTAGMQDSELLNGLEQLLASQHYQKLHLINIVCRATEPVLNQALEQNILTGISLAHLQDLLQEQNLSEWVYELSLVEETSLNFTNLDQEYWEATAPEIFSSEHVLALGKKLFEKGFLFNEFQNEVAYTALQRDSELLLRAATQRKEDLNED